MTTKNTKKINLFILFLSIVCNLTYGQNRFLQYVFELNSKENTITYSCSELDSIISKKNYDLFIDTISTIHYELGGYEENSYLKIIDYWTGEGGIRITEYKLLELLEYSYLLISEKGFVGCAGCAINFDNLSVYRIINDSLLMDKRLCTEIDKFRNYKYFTNDKQLIEESEKNDFIFDFNRENNEISIELNISVWMRNEIEDKLNGNRLILRFREDEIEYDLVDLL